MPTSMFDSKLSGSNGRASEAMESDSAGLTNEGYKVSYWVMIIGDERDKKLGGEVSKGGDGALQYGRVHTVPVHISPVFDVVS